MIRACPVLLHRRCRSRWTFTVSPQTPPAATSRECYSNEYDLNYFMSEPSNYGFIFLQPISPSIPAYTLRGGAAERVSPLNFCHSAVYLIDNKAYTMNNQRKPGMRGRFNKACYSLSQSFICIFRGIQCTTVRLVEHFDAAAVPARLHNAIAGEHRLSTSRSWTRRGVSTPIRR